MLTSAWASQFINIFGAIDEQKNGLPRVNTFANYEKPKEG
jgi:hypothetical protein